MRPIQVNMAQVPKRLLGARNFKLGSHDTRTNTHTKVSMQILGKGLYVCVYVRVCVYVCVFVSVCVYMCV